MGSELEEISDFELIDNLKNNDCEESLKEIINRHSPLSYKIFYKYSTLLNSYGIDFNEAIKEKDYVIFKAIMSFDSSRKTKFSTWLGNFTRYHCLNLVNQRKSHVTLEESELNYHIDKKSKESWGTGPREWSELREYSLNILNQIKDQRVKRVFNLRYFSDNGKMTWSKISGELGISIQTAINLHDRGAKILRKKMKSKHAEDFI